jgi:CRISPR-associated endoribonuclease Cas6
VFENESGEIIIPINYNRYVQSFIYKNISPKLANFLHNEGFKYEKRNFKLFTFSRLFGKYRIIKNEKKLEFKTPVSFYLSTIYPIIAEEFTESIIKADDMSIGKNRILLSSVEVFMKRINKDNIKIIMLSPAVVYSTLKKGDGGKKTYYYSPFEKEFSELVRKNILKKYTAYYKKKPADDRFNIKPYRVSEKKNLITTFYKKTVIKGWTGIYELEGSPELLEFSYCTGIGSKNSQGFGMWEEVQK